MEPKRKAYISEIIEEIRYGDQSQWQVGKTPQKTIAKKANPGKDKLLQNIHTRFMKK